MVEIFKEFDNAILKKIVKTIDNGGIVCFPTETVYSLVADAANHDAVDKIYKIKRLTSNKPLSVLVGDVYQAKRMVNFSEDAYKLALRFFPGPLTIILKIKEQGGLASNLNQDIGTLGVRIPSNIIALKIIKAVGRPVVSASASLSENQHFVDTEQVVNILGDKIDILIDQGITELGVESTVIDLTSEEPVIIRKGAVCSEEIENTLKCKVKILEPNN